MSEIAQESTNLKDYLNQVYDKELSGREVAECKDRLIKFFELLIEIDQRNKKLKKN